MMVFFFFMFCSSVVFFFVCLMDSIWHCDRLVGEERAGPSCSKRR